MLYALGTQMMGRYQHPVFRMVYFFHNKVVNSHLYFSVIMKVISYELSPLIMTFVSGKVKGPVLDCGEPTNMLAHSGNCLIPASACLHPGCPYPCHWQC